MPGMDFASVEANLSGQQRRVDVPLLDLVDIGLSHDLGKTDTKEIELARSAHRLKTGVGLAGKVSAMPQLDGYRAAFELPRGSYATVVLDELVKGEADLGEEAAD